MFTVYSEFDPGSTLISNIFIDQYMRDANDAQLKVYLYLLRMMNAGKSTSISDMADQFNHTEKEVLRSLRYWEKRGLIALDFDEDGDISSLQIISPGADQSAKPFPVPFRSLPVPSAASDERFRQEPPGETAADRPSSVHTVPRLRQMAIPAQHAAAYEPAERKAADPVPAGSSPAGSSPVGSSPAVPSSRYSDAASVEAFKSSAKRAQLLFVIEQYIGKPLAPAEIETVYYISEQLHFSDSLIDYLLQYCIDRGKKDFRYIEKVAVNWAENGITTPKQAERAVSSFGKNKRGIAGVRSSANPFNQFEQNQYDFDQLEKEILGN